MEQITRLFSRSMGRWLMALLLVMLSSLAVRAAQAYACFTPENTTLTFYYDDQRSTRPGTTYLLTGNAPWYDIRTSVTKVVFDPTFADARPTSGFYWFYEMTNLTTIEGLNYLNTENMTNMNGMFAYCSSLTSIDVGHFNTANSVNMGGMFYGCSGVSSLDVSNFNTSKVTNMYGMFQDCSGLTTLDVSHFNTSKVITMGSMFQNCSGLTMLDLGSFNINKVENLSNIFRGCSNLATIYVGGGWFLGDGTYNVDTSNMFYGCTSLVGGQGTHYNNNPFSEDYIYAVADNPSAGMPGYMTGKCYVIIDPDNTTLTFYYDYLANTRQGTVYYPVWFTYNPDWYVDVNAKYATQVVFDPSFAEVRPTSTFGWFYGMNHLSSLSGMEYLNTEDVTNMKNMFRDCSALTSLDLSTFYTPNLQIMDNMFYGCNHLTTIYASDLWTTQSVTYGNDVFVDCFSLVGGKGTTYNYNNAHYGYAHLDGGPSDPGYFSDANAPRAYACYTPDNTTLTFYYDNQRSSRPGTTYDLNGEFELPGWIMDWLDLENNLHPATQVVFDPSFADARPISTAYWFLGMRNLQSFSGLSYLNTSEVTNMTSMFNNCSGLTSLDLSSFNTANVAYMESMFLRCSGLTSIDLSSFNTANVGDMSDMFEDCTALTSLDLSNFNTARASFIPYMFYRCSNLTTIYAGSGWNLPADGNTEGMFQDCTSLVGSMGTSYDPNHKDGEYAHIDGGPSDPGYLSGHKEAYLCFTADNRTMTFYYDDQINNRLGTIYHLNTAGDLPEWYVQLLDNKCTKAVFDPSFADARPTSTKAWFYRIAVGSITGMEYLNTSEVTDMSYMFTGISLESLDVSHFNTAKVTNMSKMFHGSEFLTSLDLGSFNTSNVTDMNSMFTYCQSLTSLDLSNFNTANVTNMNDMFSNCSGLTSLDLSNFNTANVTDMGYMFNDCRSLTSLDLSNFNTANVTIMNGMFRNCSGLTSLDLSNFNTANVTTMNGMFSNCSGLTSLDLSNFNTANVTDLGYMFYDSRSLTSLDLSNFNTSSVTKMSGMFLECNSLETIYVGDGWSTDAVTQSADMFTDCMSLIGGMGTTYNSSNPRDKTYAHIDGGPSDPGYFSEVPQPQAYACYTPENTTLTFYYDTQRSTREGTTYDLNEGSDDPIWYTDGTNPSVTQVAFDASFADARPTSTKEWFKDMSEIQSISGLEYLNTENVTDMSSMFYGCSSITSLDLSHFNTAKVKNMGGLFRDCSGLKSVNLSGFITASVSYMNQMFYGCSNLTSLDLSSFNTRVVVFSNGMFMNCNNLVTIYASDEWSTQYTMAHSGMFTGCTSLVGGMGTTYDPNHVDKTYAHIDGGPSNPGYFTDPAVPSEPEAYACFTPSDSTLTFYFDSRRRFRSGTTYDLNTGLVQPDWLQLGTSVSHVVFDASFAEARPTTTFSWFESMSNLVSIAGMNYLNTEDVTIMASMFTECSALTSLDVSHFNTDKVTDMNGMFISCIGLTSLDVSNFNTENVTDMNNMFGNCRGLTSLDLSNFTTETVNNMRYMFYYCNNLTTIYVGNGWSTASVTNSDKMFYRCTKLVGGKGTTYDSSHINADYAHIDGGPSNPGYFTGKVDYMPSDVNGDGKTTIADVTALINYLLSGEPTAGSGDVNGDSKVTIADVTALINLLLSGS